jgi:cyclophilin family peptidyl-prolyl cis-trans isomerase
MDKVVVIETRLGRIVIEPDPVTAPLTSKNFLKLAEEGFYNQTTFHRVIPGFMIQGGDPNSREKDRTEHGRGGPGYTIPAEIKNPHIRGSVATARQGDQVNPRKESSGSQFFINVKDNDFLNGQYTVFGKVIEGMDVADKIVACPRDRADNPLERIEMTVSVVSRDQVA